MNNTTTQVKNDVSNTADSAIDQIKSKAGDAKEAIVSKAGDVKDALVGAKDKVMGTGNDLLANARSVIGSNPLTSVGIAFGVGYVAMRIFRR